jgi:hypothetical protein
MRKRRQYRGFSLTEVLLAVGTLAIGMIFISGTFLTGIHFSTIATERTYAAGVADEAFAKIRLYGINFDPFLWTGNTGYPVYPNQSVEFNAVTIIDPNEFAYPSTGNLAGKQYFWSALCRLVNQRNEPDDPNRLVQVTVFISRKVGSGTLYPGGMAGRTQVKIPVPVPVSVSGVVGSNILTVQDPSNQSFINGGYTIVENGTGQIFRVLNRDADLPDRIQLDRPLPGRPVGEPWSGLVWVVPPPVGGGKNPCIAVYQEIIRF